MRILKNEEYFKFERNVYILEKRKKLINEEEIQIRNQEKVENKKIFHEKIKL